MSMVHLGSTSKQRLSTIKPELQKVCLKAFETVPFDVTILEGIRTKERQKQLVAEGRSQTMNSRHLTGDAVDIAPYPIDWKDVARFKTLSEHMKAASKELNIPIEWGGDWKSLVDCPHYQLKW